MLEPFLHLGSPRHISTRRPYSQRPSDRSVVLVVGGGGAEWKEGIPK